MDAEGLPITMLTCTPATELVVEDGKVVGVVGECTDGTTYTVRSGNGVVLATGGYSGNFEMLKKYNTYWNFNGVDHLLHDNTSGHEGDGITLAQTLGAQVDFMGEPMMISFGSPTGSTAPMVGNHLNFMLVDGEGKRIVQREGLALRDQPGACSGPRTPPGFVVSDSTNCERDRRQGLRLSSTSTTMAAKGELYTAEHARGARRGLRRRPRRRSPPRSTGLQRARARAADGQADEFGRTIFDRRRPSSRRAPFFASPITAASPTSLPGGIVIDEEDYCALNENNERIEGLHCVGELAAERSGMPSLATGLYTVPARSSAWSKPRGRD